MKFAIRFFGFVLVFVVLLPEDSGSTAKALVQSVFFGILFSGLCFGVEDICRRFRAENPSLKFSSLPAMAMTCIAILGLVSTTRLFLSFVSALGPDLGKLDWSPSVLTLVGVLAIFSEPLQRLIQRQKERVQGVVTVERVEEIKGRLSRLLKKPAAASVTPAAEAPPVNTGGERVVPPGSPREGQKNTGAELPNQ